MKGQSFVNFLREQDGKADRQKVLSLSALVGSSVLAQLMFVGVSQAVGCTPIPCMDDCPSTCMDLGCDGPNRMCVDPPVDPPIPPRPSRPRP